MTISGIKPLSLATGVAIIAGGTIGISSAQATQFNFQFSFNDQATGTPVSGNFIFDDSIEPIVTPNGSLYSNASQSFRISVGDEVFAGLSNSIVVANDFQMPPAPTLFDVIIFDDLADFNPQNPANNTFLGLFIYPADTLPSEDLPSTLRQTAFATITTPTGVTLVGEEAFTSVTAVPEPTTIFGLLVVGALGVTSVVKKTLFK
ncbi:PEP-CTERM sorting domain-containing protein [Coleofasciculus sp. E1-EBD-02]|uniref:PEP-CTERM sorting domain-containing protein n=1 Tax=Coleofasciculus sp. E1-EBD-02 TaxID=3068481 RepID=UPI003303C72E